MKRLHVVSDGNNVHYSDDEGITTLCRLPVTGEAPTDDRLPLCGICEDGGFGEIPAAMPFPEAFRAKFGA